MVTKPDRPVPETHEGLGLSRKQEAMTPAAGFAHTNLPRNTDPIYRQDSAAQKDLANKDHSGDNKFKLPEKVSQQEIKDESFRYGGGRSAGNRSLKDNIKRQENQP